jgi:hypothetical protein
MIVDLTTKTYNKDFGHGGNIPFTIEYQDMPCRHNTFL